LKEEAKHLAGELGHKKNRAGTEYDNTDAYEEGETAPKTGLMGKVKGALSKAPIIGSSMKKP